METEQEREAFNKCLELVNKHGLDMNITNVEFANEGKVLIIYFTSDKITDYRGLVKDLIECFKIRIELRQTR